jgi:hypothetical protein
MTRFYRHENGVALSEHDTNEIIDTICAERDAALARVAELETEAAAMAPYIQAEKTLRDKLRARNAELETLLRNNIQPEADHGKDDCESCHAIFNICDAALPSRQ